MPRATSKKSEVATTVHPAVKVYIALTLGAVILGVLGILSIFTKK